MSQIIHNPWTELRRFTSARLALGRAGDSLPTDEVLEFGLAHAKAQDAVHEALDVEDIVRDLAGAGFESLTVQSEAHDRAEYLRRPDLGRNLNAEGRALLRESQGKAPSITFIIADGLSAMAPARHAVPVLPEVARKLEGWRIAPVIIATQARVALGDEIGEILGAEMTVILIGERPGLSSPDSLGIYLTYKPRIGCTDADRNCISNVRPEGLSYQAAAHKLFHLITEARRIGASGIAPKDKSARRLRDGARSP